MFPKTNRITIQVSLPFNETKKKEKTKPMQFSHTKQYLPKKNGTKGGGRVWERRRQGKGLFSFSFFFFLVNFDPISPFFLCVKTEVLYINTQMAPRRRRGKK